MCHFVVVSAHRAMYAAFSAGLKGLIVVMVNVRTNTFTYKDNDGKG
jgi:hypothetical protein